MLILLLDASQDISEQDAHIGGYILESGRALVIGVNKWDMVDDYRREQVKLEINRKLRFLDFAHTHYVSATKGIGVNGLLKHANVAYRSAMTKMSTGRLNRILADAVAHQQPKRAGGGRPKLKYVHQGGSNPPIIVIHGNALDHISPSYKRYLEGRFIDAFKLVGTPMRVEFRNSENPYADKSK